MHKALILPAYNESLTIGAVLTAFNKEIPDATFVIIDNNSSDNTLSIARETCASLGIAPVLLRETRQGKSFAVEQAFRKIDADIYILVDADMTYPAESVHALIAPVRNGVADMVVGDRHVHGNYKRENKRAFHNIGNNLVKFLVNALFHSKLNDILSGYRVFSRQFVKTFPILGKGFTLEAEMTLHALDKHMTVVELPVEYKDRPEGSFSKLNTYRDGLAVLNMIFDILRNYRPLMFFGLLSMAVFFCGLAAGFPVVREFILTGYIRRVPLAILSSGLMVVSLVTFAIGIILDTVAIHQRFNFRLKILDSTDKTEQLERKSTLRVLS